MTCSRAKAVLQRLYQHPGKRLSDYKKERRIRAALRNLSKQRVKKSFGTAWDIENLVPDDDETKLALDSCLMRGWVQEISDPRGQITFPPPPPPVPPGERPQRHLPIIRMGPYYRPTDIGWAVIHRTHQLHFLGVLVGIGAFILAALALQPSNQTDTTTDPSAPHASTQSNSLQGPDASPPLRQPSAALRWP